MLYFRQDAIPCGAYVIPYIAFLVCVCHAVSPRLPSCTRISRGFKNFQLLYSIRSLPCGFIAPWFGTLTARWLAVKSLHSCQPQVKNCFLPFLSLEEVHACRSACEKIPPPTSTQICETRNVWTPAVYTAVKYLFNGGGGGTPWSDRSDRIIYRENETCFKGGTP